ncbi:hypothetical protein CICLE_v10004126mg [Citrus x clementina]|uniref:Kinesin motor domain-containing protein n=1 Tax=Citrus clementina TaxID=85681 RepID=V4RF68_CITCL|nr:hypothetical protein CICLE_v10004126mg [Citrus x clementina]
MSKEAISSRLPSKTSQNEANENQFGASLNPLHFPPPRSPLNSIPDPSQFQKDIQESDQVYSIDRSLSDRKVVETSGSFVATHVGTPRVSVRSHGKIHSEPSSAQSTPARSGCSRVSLGGRGVSSSALFSRISRGISVVNHEVSVDVEHFELVDDPLFWKDHNVQVLIRIRPLSNIERVSQGYVRCLKQDTAQTLVWLGHPETRFTFDHIACEMISQEKLFRVAGLPMVENCLSGYNSCMFAYGQTGSGKTYTMMGEINEVEGKLNDDCGITPRIFEYLFSRIRMEEENRRDERLKFSCKCSFLEIYNEQITDLLEPSSTNLQLREDLKKGVYVENLTEYNVKTVNDVVKLLLQGAANRKMAATYMNSESSRSHSVLTCIIESHWEKDSMTHFRFARLNLVDLAGSERQKSSGAEGDRLKEAANINKSLSTLGLVIMSLVDSAQGKHRHVPYRDSRLTFLLQDSLGGNSKTTIIANVSPSICSANETLSTLKFAQRAKLIQNNAKVNENASGDVTALQRQIQQLKDQLSSLMKHQNLLRSPSSSTPEVGESSQGDIIKKYSFPGEGMMDNGVQNVQNEKTKRLECMLLGALRREKMAEAVTQKLEAEIEHMNRLLCQREEDTQHTKMMLRFREEKIKQLELLVNGSVTAEKYLMDENIALKEEIQLLQARNDRNPELTRFALENIRLLEQLQLFQSFYEQGEREKLLAELAELRDQDNDTTTELENCRNMNSKLMREVEELRTELRNCGQATSSSVSLADELLGEVETISMKTDSGDEQTPYNLTDDQNMRNDQILHPSDTEKQLTDAKMLIEALEREQVHQNRELHLMQEQNQRYMEVLSHRDYAEGHSLGKSGSYCLESNNFEKQKKGMIKESSKGIDGTSLQAKLDKLTEELETARVLNCQYQEDQASQLSCQHQVDLVREQVEMEATKTILQLQEEVASLQLELHENLCCMTEENTCLRNTIAAKEEEIRSRCTEWEKATLELTNFLADGSRSLRDASGQIESIVCLFPQFNVEVTENVGRAAKVCIEKDETILLLQKSLEEAQKMVVEMKEKCISLKGATIALNEIQHLGNEECTDEAIHLSMTLNKKIEMVKLLESELKSKEDQITEAEKRAQASFLVAVASETSNHASSFFSKFEEARETMREADSMLNTLLKANENAKQLNDKWRQAGEQLMADRASLTDEVEQLKFLIRLKEEENELLMDHLHFNMSEIDTSISLLEECFLQVQKEVEDRFKELYSDALLMGRDVHHFISNSKSLQDDIFSGIMEKGFQQFVFYLHLSYENLSLKKELQRKEVLLQGLLFDFSLLQESASNKKDIKDETEKLFSTLSQVRQDLDRKASQLDNLLLQHEKLEASLTDTENALVIAKGTIDTLSDQNADLRVLLKDLYLKKSQAEEHLEEQKEVITGLEKEILHRTSEDKRDKLCEEVESVEEELRKVSKERDKLWEEICSLNDKLAMAYALADENEAIAVEARQELEASKLYAEQKEEEVKILEHSIEELEHTVNALEKKVYEMNGEVERHHLIRDSLELEIQALRRRLSTVQNFSDIVDSENINAGHTEDQMSRKLQDRLLQLQEAHHRIQLLEREKEEQNEEIKRCKDYLSEVVLHSEAQASQYQQKYKTLEAMIREMQTNLSNTTAAAAPAQDKIEKSSTRLRGSSSPFRCIASVVQQMNSEKDQELSAATLRIQKLEALAASRQKEVCMLNTRLAAAESMTHDVIRDLLGVKLDMTNYANLIDQEHVQKLVVAAQQQTQELLAKEQIILNLRKRIEDLIEEHESCTSILKQREADILAAHINVEQLRERDQLLSAQNDMLKMDKTNLLKRISELDDMVKMLLGTQSTQEQIQQKQSSKNKESSFMKLGDRDTDFTRRLSYSEKLLPRVNSKLAQYRQAGTSRPQDKTYLPALKQNTGSRRLSSI